MSSILKALKRIEQQKLVRKTSNHDIAWIVRGEDFRPEKKRQWPMFVSLVAVALLAVLSTYWFMGGFHEPSRDSLARPDDEARSSSGIPPVAALAPPRPSRPDPPPVSTPDTAAFPPAFVNRTAKKGLRNSSRDLFSKSVRQSGESQALATPRVPQTQAALPPRLEPVPVSQPPKSSHPALTVTGIAWEKDSPVHLAIVNGTSVVEGSMVHGVRVEKILPDRVRFTFENSSFEVHLNQGDGGN